VLVKSGTEFRGKLQQEIATNKSHDGDTFTIVQQDTLMHKEPRFMALLSKVTLRRLGSRRRQEAGVTIVFDDVRMADGKQRRFTYESSTLAPSTPKRITGARRAMVIRRRDRGHMRRGNTTAARWAQPARTSSRKK